ncbi:MAG: DUF3124 domain-containing protein [Proteobacteria bacterium]|nr:DUF3124 domain-containing protein [Pseudomonadota bacterium]MBU4470227.1 DUF3124 domain-containing protein [Pseudomonadota bacterium]MCG2752642.1 DUF3124 domain-containing protein [Desulfobacteraceae bacterium]
MKPDAIIKSHRISSSIVLVLSLICVAGSSKADSESRLSNGESLYVSVYSNVYSGPKAKPFELATMLSLRNTDPKYAITILKADYFDNNGKLVEGYVKEALTLGPLASTYIYIKEYDKRGGPGANFIVKWRSKNPVNPPIIEGISLGLASGQGLAFTCPGQVIEEYEE